MTPSSNDCLLADITPMIALASDVGHQRSVNEDFALFENPPAEALEAKRKGALVIVADGLGGHAGGDVASQIAAQVVRQVYYLTPAEPGEALQR
ncbi:MAG: PP2C family protein-serine/threonine phosphatase, partial [Acidobacteriota bacterium]